MESVGVGKNRILESELGIRVEKIEVRSRSQESKAKKVTRYFFVILSIYLTFFILDLAFYTSYAMEIFLI